MKKIFTTAALALVLTSCAEIKSKGPIISETRHITNVADEIDVESAIKLVLSDNLEKGELLIKTHENIIQYVIVSYDDNKVSIEMNDDYRYKNLDVEVLVSASQYNDILAKDACNVTVEGTLSYFNHYEIEIKDASKFEGNIMAGNTINIECSDASDFEGAIQAEDKVMIECSDASHIDISGTTLNCEIKASDASSIQDTDFACEHLKVDISDASSVRMSVSQSITGKLSDASTLLYLGNPTTVSVETSDASSVKKL